jgi:alkanesulfonate monooxygenase SsuD/methylene tetrahydromethanopterin reductase-like flavin-dependent oxidoreductase (luciferase family)
MADIRVGLKLSQSATIDQLRAVWQVADEAGFDHCWCMDHFATLGQRDDGAIFEAWTLLDGMAVATSRTRIGCMVTGNTYRHPAVLAKAAVTVDHLSGGRLEFGLGAGWAENEHIMLGLPFGARAERADWLEEACQVIRSLWTQPQTSFDGQHYKLAGAVAEPAGAAAVPADLDRRVRSAAHPADHRAVRRCVERGRGVPAGGSRAVRRTGPAMRRDRPRSGANPPLSAVPRGGG